MDNNIELNPDLQDLIKADRLHSSYQRLLGELPDAVTRLEKISSYLGATIKNLDEGRQNHTEQSTYMTSQGSMPAKKHYMVMREGIIKTKEWVDELKAALSETRTAKVKNLADFIQKLKQLSEDTKLEEVIFIVPEDKKDALLGVSNVEEVQYRKKPNDVIAIWRKNG